MGPESSTSSSDHTIRTGNSSSGAAGREAKNNDENNYFITEDGIDLSSDGVDLLPRSDEAESGISNAAESEPSRLGGNENDDQVRTTNATSTYSNDFTDYGIGNPTSTHMYDDDDDDDEEDDGIYIDEEIVQSVLGSSEDRIQERENRDLRKCCFYGLSGIVFLFLLAIIVDSDVLMRGYIQHQGTAYPFNDREEFRDLNETGSDDHFISDADRTDTMKFASHFDNAVNVKGPAFQPAWGEIPFFFTKGNQSPVLEQIFSRCLGFVIAGDKPGPIELRKDKLIVYSLDKETNARKYVNVDLTSTEGVQRAANLKLAQSGLPDVIMSNYLHMGLDALFSNETQARLFILMKHPVDLAVSTYYDFTQTAAEEVLRSMTLEEFINSKYYVGNVLTKIIWHGWGPETPAKQHLHVAQGILRSKFLIGIYDDLWASIQLFEDYFFWNEIGNHPDTLSCKRELQKGEMQRELDMYREVGEVKMGGEVYNRIVELNAIDMELYWFSVDLHRAQRAWIPTNA